MKGFNSEIIFLFCIVVLAVFIRIMAMQIMPDYLIVDNPTYQAAANDLLRTGTISNHYIMPLYPLVLALFGGGAFAQTLVGLISGGITTILIWCLSRHIFLEKHVGLVAALIYALYPMAIFYGVKGLTESLFIMFLIAAFLSMYKDKITMASLFFVLTILSRPVADLFAPFVIMWFTVIVKKDRPIIVLKNLSIYGLIYLVMMSPWWLHNYNKHHEFIRLNLGYGIVLYSGNNNKNITGGGIGGLDYDLNVVEKYSNPLEKDAFLRREAQNYISDNLYHFVKMMWVKFKRVWNFFPYHESVKENIFAIFATLSLIPILVSSFVTLIYRRDIFIYLTPLIGFIVYLTLLHMITIGSIRYRYPMEIIMILIASPTILKFYNLIARRFFKVDNI